MNIQQQQQPAPTASLSFGGVQFPQSTLPRPQQPAQQPGPAKKPSKMGSVQIMTHLNHDINCINY
eukprot:UN03408